MDYFDQSEYLNKSYTSKALYWPIILSKLIKTHLTTILTNQNILIYHAYLKSSLDRSEWRAIQLLKLANSLSPYEVWGWQSGMMNGWYATYKAAWTKPFKQHEDDKLLPTVKVEAEFQFYDWWFMWKIQAINYGKDLYFISRYLSSYLESEHRKINSTLIIFSII